MDMTEYDQVTMKMFPKTAHGYYDIMIRFEGKVFDAMPKDTYIISGAR